MYQEISWVILSNYDNTTLLIWVLDNVKAIWEQWGSYINTQIIDNTVILKKMDFFYFPDLFLCLTFPLMISDESQRQNQLYDKLETKDDIHTEEFAQERRCEFSWLNKT